MGSRLGVGVGEPGPTCTEAELLLRHPRARWQGWGCSLAWCGKALGADQEAEAWADLLFTLNDVVLERLWPGAEFSQQCPRGTVPGLGLNVVRYNIGGTGRVEDASGEKRSGKTRGWHAEIEGFLPAQGGQFDWERDECQRRFLKLAVDRGADEVELFSNAPMWWMSGSRSSFGGTLESPDAFATYLADVAAHARSEWQVPVKSVAPFNEPSAGWWNFPHDQEGCNIPIEEQEGLLVRLRGELDQRGLDDVLLAASDENRPDTAERTWKKLKTGPALGCVGRINVHSYDGLDPWKEKKHPGTRASLRRLVSQDGLPVWMSEFGNGSKNGLDIARTIMEDLHFMRPTAWCYWQLVEHRCSWGFVEAEFGPDGSRAVMLPHPKFYVFAQFSRFLRPGMEMLHGTEPWVAAGFSEEEGRLAAVFLNEASEARRLTVRAPCLRTRQQSVQVVTTEPDKGVFMKESQDQVAFDEAGAIQISVDVPACAVCSVALCEVYRSEDQAVGNGPGVTVALVEELTRLAASAAYSERSLHGESGLPTERLKAQAEHVAGRAASTMERALPGDESAARRLRELQELQEVIWTSSWGAANERKYSPTHRETEEAWRRFRAARKQCCLPDDLVWAIFNTTWAVVNEACLGADSEDAAGARARAVGHLSSLGGRSVEVLPGRLFRSPAHVPSAPRWVALVGQAEGGAVEAALPAGVAAEAALSADLVVSTPSAGAVHTAQALHSCGSHARVALSAAACECREGFRDNQVPKQELMALVPQEALAWEGWAELPDMWWPTDDEDSAARARAFREAVRRHAEDRVVFVARGSFWQQIVGRHLEPGEVLFCDRQMEV